MRRILLVVVVFLIVDLTSAAAAELVFNRAKGLIGLFDQNGTLVGKWQARNNVVKQATPFPIGTYPFSYRQTHEDDGPGSNYGTYGTLLFRVERRDVGVHSGQANAEMNPGPAHPTQGSIRTTDEAMQAIVAHHAKDKIKKITAR